jgi:hypothetical protein
MPPRHVPGGIFIALKQRSLMYMAPSGKRIACSANFSACLPSMTLSADEMCARNGQ